MVTFLLRFIFECLEPAIERTEADREQLGGQCLIAIGGSEYFADVSAFEFADRFSGRAGDLGGMCWGDENQDGFFLQAAFGL